MKIIPTIILSAAVLLPAESLKAQTAEEILTATGVKGGMVVHLGCGDGSLTADLRLNDSYRVQGLAFTEAELQQTRTTVRSRGLYGDRVSAVLCPPTHLPYRTDMVKLLVAEDLKHISMEEVMRVLTPKGVAYLKTTGTWEVVQKPWPQEIDEWTHYFHDVDNNPVASDTKVGPPTQWQWGAGPVYSREHEYVSSVSAAVTANGRVFSIFDREADLTIFMPADWRIVARDAFSGVLLWEKKIPKWIDTHYRYKYGPAQIPRRLVAVGDRVYVTSSIDGPVVELDAATGETLRTYEGTAVTDEIIYEDGILYLVNIPAPSELDLFQRTIGFDEYRWKPLPRVVMAVNAQTGRILWRHDDSVMRVTLTMGGGRVYFYNGTSVVGLDKKTGKKLWESPPLVRNQRMTPEMAPRIAYYNEMLVYVGSETVGRGTGGSWGGKDAVHGICAKTGELVWVTRDIHPASGYTSPEDLYIMQGLVWFGCNMSKRDIGEVTGLDPMTGEVVKQFDTETRGWHHRCHPGKATERYLISSWARGTEYIDVAEEYWHPTIKWLRSACLYGMMPANGFSYFLPHPCQCNPEGQITGYNAFSVTRPFPVERIPDTERLEKGPAYAAPQKGSIKDLPETAWPTYRYAPDRRGATPMPVSTELQLAWRASLSGDLTALTVAEGKVFAASPEHHEVYALDALTGKEAWRVTVGGAVDSPPTSYKGVVLFGSRDGYAYALRASDGALAWKFNAAEHSEQMVFFDDLESVWPLHGSVLVDRDIAYIVAGRSLNSDNGLTFYQLNPLTGELLFKRNFFTDGENKRTDILSSSGDHIHMRASMIMDVNNDLAVVDKLQPWENHLSAPNGFLDGTWWTRSYWVYSNFMAGGHAGWQLGKRTRLSGRMLVHDDETIYGYGGRKRDTGGHRGPPQMLLFSGPRDVRQMKMVSSSSKRKKKQGRQDRRNEGE
jgi:outer membrane protein assembly factor BamB